MYTIDRIITLKNMQQHVDYRPHLRGTQRENFSKILETSFLLSKIVSELFNGIFV